MNFWTLLPIGALLAMVVLLVAARLHVGTLQAQFSLLDRGGAIPRIRWQVQAALVLAVLALVAAGAGALVQGQSTTSDVALQQMQEMLDQSEHRIVGLETELARRPTVEVTAVESVDAPTEAPAAATEADAVEAPPSAPTPVPPKSRARSAAANGWYSARISAAGDVTLRAWPNGRDIGMLSPGTVVQTQDQLKVAGNHEWIQVRLPTGQTGWVVERFVVIQRNGS